MFPILISLISLTLSANITQSPLPNIQSGVVVVYENTIIMTINTESVYTITYSKTYTIPLIPFYFLNRYKMKDKFIYQNFYTYVKSNSVDNWKLAVQPVATTSVLALSVSYIAVENIYENFFVKDYTYGVQAGLGTGVGSRSYTVNYNFSQEFIGSTLSNYFSQNKLILSWVGFWHTNSISPTLDMYINSYFSNTSFYSIAISTSVSGDWWNRTNVMACIINIEKFPSTVRLLSGTVVLSTSNTIKSWTDFDQFINVSYCFGYSGINTNTNENQDMYWTEKNGTAIQAHLSFLVYGRFSYIIMWNETVAVAPVDPVTPVTPVDPITPVTPNKTDPIVAPVDPVEPIDPNPTPNPSQNSTDPGEDPREQSSNSPIGIIIGVVVGVIVIGAIVVFVIFRPKNKKGHRVPIPQNQKEFHLFTPSFV